MRSANQQVATARSGNIFLPWSSLAERSLRLNGKEQRKRPEISEGAASTPVCPEAERKYLS